MTTARGNAPDRTMEAPSQRPAALEVRLARPQDAGLQDELARACPEASFFHQTAWSRAIADVYGHRPVEFLAFEAGRLVGALPLMRCRSLRGVPSLISMPYAVYGGPIGANAATRDALVRAAMEHADGARVGRLELRCEQAPGVELVPHELYSTFVKDLPAAPEEVLAGMPKKARAEARKARSRHALELQEGEHFLADLHRLFHRNKHALGSPGLPRSWFERLQAGFGSDVRLHAVVHAGEPVMVVMSFVWRDTLMAYYAGSTEGADRTLSASNFMYLALQEWAVEQGLRRFDFGRSRSDSGAFQFKRHQGFEPRLLPYRVHLVRDDAPPSFTPSNPKTRRLRETWTRLPPWLTTRLSDRLARFLP